MFSKLKLRNEFQEIALVDFVALYSKPWLHLIRTDVLYIFLVIFIIS